MIDASELRAVFGTAGGGGKVSSWVDWSINTMLSLLQEEFNREVPLIFEEFHPIAINAAKDAFHKAMSDFYDSFNRKYYEPTGGLYKLFTEVAGSGGSESASSGFGDTNSYSDGEESSADVSYPEHSIAYDYDKSKMHGTRNGGHSDYLFDIVFKKGYHGGGPDKSGKLRYRVPYGTVWTETFKPFRYWGRLAEQTTPPEQLADKEIEAAFDAVVDDLDRIVNEHGSVAIDRAQDRFESMEYGDL